MYMEGTPINDFHSSPPGWGSSDLRTVPRESLSQGMQDPLSHIKSSWEGLVSWSQCHRKGTWSTLEAMRGEQRGHSWGRWLWGPLVGHCVGWGRLASYSAMSIVWLWATCSTPLYPSFYSLSCPFSFPGLLTKDWPSCVCVHTSSLGLTWAFWLLSQHKCNSPEFQTHRPAVWPGLCFCKDQSCILDLFLENLICRCDTLQRKQYWPEKFPSSKSHLKPTMTSLLSWNCWGAQDTSKVACLYLCTAKEHIKVL